MVIMPSHSGTLRVDLDPPTDFHSGLLCKYNSISCVNKVNCIFRMQGCCFLVLNTISLSSNIKELIESQMGMKAHALIK